MSRSQATVECRNWGIGHCWGLSMSAPVWPNELKFHGSPWMVNKSLHCLFWVKPSWVWALAEHTFCVCTCVCLIIIILWFGSPMQHVPSYITRVELEWWVCLLKPTLFSVPADLSHMELVTVQWAAGRYAKLQEFHRLWRLTTQIIWFQFYN